MSELDDAIATLERAVARLEAAPSAHEPEPEPAANPAALRQIAERVDAALSRIEQLLGGDG